MLSDELAAKLDVAKKSRTEDHSIGAEEEHPSSVVQASDPPTDLAWDGDRRDDPFHQSGLDRMARARPVKIDQVQAGSTLPCPALGDGHGIESVDGLPFEVSLPKPHDHPVPKVDGGDQLHTRIPLLTSTM